MLGRDLDCSSTTLLVAFGAMKLRIGIPPFEFLNMTGAMPVKKLFVRDAREAWYHNGLPRYGDSLVEVADDLRDLIASYEVERLVFAGASAGGYAALVFGTLLGADMVLSFSPQTVLDPSELAAMGDHRWDGYLMPLLESGALDQRWSDLRVALSDVQDDPAVARHIYFDEETQFDRMHAERLKGLPGVRLLRFGGGSHNLVRTLRDNGALETILTQAVLGAQARTPD